MQSAIRLVLCVMAAPLLGACNALPTVEYVKVSSASDAKGITDSFYLAQSEIVIDRLVVENKDKTKSEQQFTITSRPIELRDYKVGIKPADSWGVKTKINIVKRENTDLVASIGVETVDDRKKFIEQVGGAVVKVIGLAAAVLTTTPDGTPPPAPPKPCIPDDAFPVTLRPAAADLKGATTLSFSPSGQKNGCITITLHELPKDAIEQIAWDAATSNYYYSACRDATVTFQAGKPVKHTVRIADPNRVQFVQLPFKGSVTAHSQCGVSVKTESTGSSTSGAELIDALAVQAKAIKDALDAANK